MDELSTVLLSAAVLYLAAAIYYLIRRRQDVVGKAVKSEPAACRGDWFLGLAH